jgi:hypothetical protein
MQTIRSYKTLFRLLVMWLVLISIQLHGSTITIENTITASTDGTIETTVANLGDDVAQHIIVSCEFQGEEQVGTGPSRINPAEHGRYAFKFVPNEVPGVHMIVVRVAYKHPDGDPASSIFLHNITFGEVGSSKVLGVIDKSALAGTGVATLKVRNSDDTEINVAVAVYVPHELIVGAVKSDVVLRPGGSESIAIPLENFSALSGPHGIYAILKYQKDGIQFAAAVTGQVDVVDASELSSEPIPAAVPQFVSRYSILLIIVVVVALIGVFFLGRWSARRRLTPPHGSFSA